MTIFTLGAANRQEYRFTKILSRYRIQVIFDIRHSPTVPHAPHFNRSNLQRLCASQNTDYVYMGNVLSNLPEEKLWFSRGDRRKGGSRRITVPGDAQNWFASTEFRRWADLIADKATKRVTCILCSEFSPAFCYRAIFADVMIERGFEVIHILDEERFQRHAELRSRFSPGSRPHRDQ